MGAQASRRMRRMREPSQPAPPAPRRGAPRKPAQVRGAAAQARPMLLDAGAAAQARPMLLDAGAAAQAGHRRKASPVAHENEGEVGGHPRQRRHGDFVLCRRVQAERHVVHGPPAVHKPRQGGLQPRRLQPQEGGGEAGVQRARERKPAAAGRGEGSRAGAGEAGTACRPKGSSADSVGGRAVWQAGRNSSSSACKASSANTLCGSCAAAGRQQRQRQGGHSLWV